ncbi:MAG: hypothetical protein H7233_11875 [Pseudorhodobacter sp.]|nr:hypothetical protein [Frankiaceae bacterium]
MARAAACVDDPLRAHHVEQARSAPAREPHDQDRTAIAQQLDDFPPT